MPDIYKEHVIKRQQLRSTSGTSETHLGFVSKCGTQLKTWPQNTTQNNNRPEFNSSSTTHRVSKCKLLS